MDYFLKKLLSLKDKIKVGRIINASTVKDLNKLYIGFVTCGRKLTSAAKFTDFLVHNILDYTLLSKNKEGFTKIMKNFNVRTAVREVTDILEDKLKLK